MSALVLCSKRRERFLGVMSSTDDVRATEVTETRCHGRDAPLFFTYGSHDVELPSSDNVTPILSAIKCQRRSGGGKPGTNGME